MKNEETIERICLNLILSNNKIAPKPYDIEHKYCYGCIKDIKNDLCPHYIPIRVWTIEVKEKK